MYYFIIPVSIELFTTIIIYSAITSFASFLYLLVAYKLMFFNHFNLSRNLCGLMSKQLPVKNCMLCRIKWGSSNEVFSVNFLKVFALNWKKYSLKIIALQYIMKNVFCLKYQNFFFFKMCLEIVLIFLEYMLLQCIIWLILLGCYNEQNKKAGSN